MGMRELHHILTYRCGRLALWITRKKNLERKSEQLILSLTFSQNCIDDVRADDSQRFTTNCYFRDQIAICAAYGIPTSLLCIMPMTNLKRTPTGRNTTTTNGGRLPVGGMFFSLYNHVLGPAWTQYVFGYYRANTYTRSSFESVSISHPPFTIEMDFMKLFVAMASVCLYRYVMAQVYCATDYLIRQIRGLIDVIITSRFTHTEHCINHRSRQVAINIE